MKLLVFSDIHGDHAALGRLMATDADYYFAAGDLTSWGRGLDGCGEILRRRGDRMYVLPGNHESNLQIAEFSRRFGFIDFHGRSFEAGGYHIAGLGYSTPTPFNTPGEYTEQEMARRLELFAKLEPLVLVCHCPPAGTDLDRVRKGVHAGSTAVRDFIEQRQPAYFFCGHIHEAEGQEIQIGKTLCWNVGRRGHLLEL
ncbi:MAG: metallophosphoesterase [Bryobacteraceae bacterium]